MSLRNENPDLPGGPLPAFLTGRLNGRPRPPQAVPPRSHSPAPPADPDAPPLHLGAAVGISGDIEVEGDVVLSGLISGSLRCRRAFIEADGEFEGTLIADEVTVWGSVEGEVYAQLVTLKSGCRVLADMYHGMLTLDRDAFFEGKSRRHPDPKALMSG